MQLSLEVPIVRAAYELGAELHAQQVRKYTGEPYFRHCVEVAELVCKAPGVRPEVIAAALLHDTLEDTDVGEAGLRSRLGLNGARVVSLVKQVTDVSRPHDGNRAVRKAKDLAHLKRATPWGQTIKYADMISNTRSIAEHDRGFARVYLPEKRAILEALVSGDRGLRRQAMDVLRKAEGDLIREDQAKQFAGAMEAHEIAEAYDAQRASQTIPGWGSF